MTAKQRHRRRRRAASGRRREELLQRIDKALSTTPEKALASAAADLVKKSMHKALKSFVGSVAQPPQEMAALLRERVQDALVDLLRQGIIEAVSVVSVEHDGTQVKVIMQCQQGAMDIECEGLLNF